jgi:ketosteroid isomerase-like protein
VAVSDLDDFLTLTLTRQVEAEQAPINGDPTQRLAMTSTQDPVTIFGAKVPLRRGWDEVSETLRWLAARWSDSTDYRFDLVAAGVSGDLAYLVGFEHIANSVVGIPVEPYTLRVTHIFRREDGERSRRSSSESGPRQGHIPPERQGQQR